MFHDLFQDTEYLVKWSGYSKYESMWEVSDNISEDSIWSVFAYMVFVNK